MNDLIHLVLIIPFIPLIKPLAIHGGSHETYLLCHKGSRMLWWILIRFIMVICVALGSHGNASECGTARRGLCIGIFQTDWAFRSPMTRLIAVSAGGL